MLSHDEQEIAEAFKGESLSRINQVLLKENLKYIMTLVGITVVPSSAQLLLIEELAKSEYGRFTINEMRLAFKMNILGKLGDTIEHFQNFSPDYFAKVMTAYKRKATEIRKLIPVKTEDEPVPKIDPMDVIEYSFQDWRERTDKDFEKVFNAPRVFDLIQETGLKNWTDEDGKVAFEKLRELANFKANKMNLISAKEYRASWTPEWKKLMARNVAVALYFNEQITNGKETLK